MKKSILYVGLACSILFLGIFILRPLSGSYYHSLTSTEPGDFLSRMMQKLSKPEIGKPIDLNAIDHIIVRQESLDDGNVFINIFETDSSRLIVRNSFDYQNYIPEINGRTLTIRVTDINQRHIEIALQPQQHKTLTLQGKSIQLSIVDNISPAYIFPKLILENQAIVRFNNYNNRNEQFVLKDLDVALSGKSILSITNLKIGNLQASLNQSRLDLVDRVQIDSLQADLQQRSHIMHANVEQTDNIKHIQVSGDTEYYLAHKR